jgi:hypothetical protein
MPKDPYMKRTIEPVLRKAIKDFPAVILRDPRQPGKTTFLERPVGGTHRYVSLEPPDLHARILFSVLRHPSSVLCPPSSVHCHLVLRLFRLTFTQIR